MLEFVQDNDILSPKPVNETKQKNRFLWVKIVKIGETEAAVYHSSNLTVQHGLKDAEMVEDVKGWPLSDGAGIQNTNK